MAIKNQDGRLISFSCEKMIAEVAQDVWEFGGKSTVSVVAISKLMHGVRIIVDWYFKEDDCPELRGDRKDFEIEEEMTLPELLRRLKIQDEPVLTEEEMTGL